MTPATTALLDQLDAASRQARRVVERTVERLDAAGPTDLPAGPISRRLLERMTVRALAGRQPSCEHVGASPQLVWLLGWVDGLLCSRCAQAAMGAVRGTPEDHVCDGCRRADRGLLTVVVAACGPVMLVLGLCPPCLAVETAAGS